MRVILCAAEVISDSEGAVLCAEGAEGAHSGSAGTVLGATRSGRRTEAVSGAAGALFDTEEVDLSAAGALFGTEEVDLSAVGAVLGATRPC